MKKNIMIKVLAAALCLLFLTGCSNLNNSEQSEVETGIKYADVKINLGIPSARTALPVYEWDMFENFVLEYFVGSDTSKMYKVCEADSYEEFTEASKKVPVSNDSYCFRLVCNAKDVRTVGTFPEGMSVLNTNNAEMLIGYSNSIVLKENRINYISISLEPISSAEYGKIVISIKNADQLGDISKVKVSFDGEEIFLEEEDWSDFTWIKRDVKAGNYDVIFTAYDENENILGWYPTVANVKKCAESRETIDFGKIVSAEQKYTKINFFLDGKNAVEGDEPDFSLLEKTGDYFLNPKDYLPEEIIPENYVLLGFNTKADLSGNFYKTSNIVKSDYDDLTLYCFWIEKDEQDGVYLIHDNKDFVNVIKFQSSGSSMKLLENLDFTGIDIPVGTATLLDGNGNEITGLVKPLFKNVNGVVKNLTIKDCNIEIQGQGGALGEKNYGTIQNCHLKNVRISNMPAPNSMLGDYKNVGGFAGVMDFTGEEITDCSVEDCYIGGGDEGVRVGGIVGRISTGAIKNCSVINSEIVGGDEALVNEIAVGIKGTITGSIKTGNNLIGTESVISGIYEAKHGETVLITFDTPRRSVQPIFDFDSQEGNAYAKLYLGDNLKKETDLMKDNTKHTWNNFSLSSYRTYQLKISNENFMNRIYGTYSIIME